MISHGLDSGALFLYVGVLYDQLHSGKIETYGGVAYSMPVFAALMMLFTLSNVGLPSTSGFVGELLVIIGAFQESAICAGTTAPTDLNAQEKITLCLIALLVLLLGVSAVIGYDSAGVSCRCLSHIQDRNFQIGCTPWQPELPDAVIRAPVNYPE